MHTTWKLKLPIASITTAALTLGALSVVTLSASAASDGSPDATYVTVEQSQEGSLSTTTRRQNMYFDVAQGGSLTTTLTYTGTCQKLVLKSWAADGQRNVVRGGSPLTTTQTTSSGTLKVQVQKRNKERTCTADWQVTSALTYEVQPEPPAPSATTPFDHGAVGDGVADDTGALQSALDSLESGETLSIPAGHTFAHNDVLLVNKAGVTIEGEGTLLATNEARSALYVDADDVRVSGITVAATGVTQRWAAYEQMKLRVGSVSGTRIENVTIDGSAAAGLYVGSSQQFELVDVVVRDTRADGIHITTGARDGLVQRPVVERPGDDGVAVVSYNDHEPVTNVTVESPTVRDQSWGRGISVVGGTNIHYSNVRVENSAGAGVYIAAESEFHTHGINNVTVDGGALINSNQQADKDAVERPSPDKGRIVHGAVLVYNSQADETISDVSVKNLTINDTHPQGYDHVSVLSYDGQTQETLAFENIDIAGGSQYTFKSLGVPDSEIRRANWTHNGENLADAIGW